MFLRCFKPIALLVLTLALAWPQQGDISSPGRPDSSLPQVSLPEGFDPNSREKLGVTTDEGKVRFPTQTVLVQVPIVVKDKSGAHLHGLSKSDFHISENGREQRIATFEEILTTNTPLAGASARPGEFSNLTPTDRQPRPVAVIALDAINTSLSDQANARRELIKYLVENLDSSPVLALMIITTRGVKVVHGLTDDPAQLVQLVKGAAGDQPALIPFGTDVQTNAALGDIPETPTDISNPLKAAAALQARNDTITTQVEQQRAIEQTLNAMLAIAWSLAGVPGRKSLIWATGGFPFAISSAEQVPGGDLGPLYERVVQALDVAQISVYPVDVRGLVATDALASTMASTAPKFAHQINNRAEFQRSQIQTLQEFADMTGGKAFYDTNDLASSFKHAADDASSYYLAGYYLDTHDKNAGWRELSVKVDAKYAEVRAREGFFVTNITMNPELTRSADLAYALSSPIDCTGVPLGVRWLGTSGAGTNKKTEFMVHLPPGSLSIESTGEKKHLNFDFAAAAYPNKGDHSPVTASKTISTTVPDAQMPSVLANGIDMKNALQLVPGDYRVRVVIRDNVTAKIGSVTTPLTVN